MSGADALPAPRIGGLRASRICLGTADFGSAVNRVDSFMLMDAFLDLGGNFLDTAHCYADWQCELPGMSERTIGNWMATRGCRDRVIIGTKGAHPILGSGGSPRLSPEDVRQDLNESLRRLGIDTIDLYWLHRDDPSRPVSQILDTLETARQEGLIRCYGASNWSVARLQIAADYAKQQDIPGFVASQIEWSLAARNPETKGDTVQMDEETYIYHLTTQMPAVPYSSQAGGFFSENYHRGKSDSGRAGIHRQYGSDPNWKRLERARELAKQLGCTANQIAVAYLLAQSFPTYPIVGCRRMSHLLDSCAAVGIRLTAEQVRYLESDSV